METEFHGSDALRVGGGAEALALVVLQRLDPAGDVARVMWNIGRDAEFVPGLIANAVEAFPQDFRVE
jgi:hypothetical protein